MFAESDVMKRAINIFHLNVKRESDPELCTHNKSSVVLCCGVFRKGIYVKSFLKNNALGSSIKEVTTLEGGGVV